MPILASEAEPQPPPAPTQEVIDAVMDMQRQHCAPSTWDRFVKSLAANRFPFRVSP